MDLTIYDIIKGPVLSGKAVLANNKHKKLVVKVHQDANKPLIKLALEKIFDVKVEKVNCLNRLGKTRRVGRRIIERQSTKIAIVTLKEGYSLNLFNQVDSVTDTASNATGSIDSAVKSV